MLQAFLTDAITVILILFIFCACVAIAAATISEAIQVLGGQKALKKVDAMYKEYGDVAQKDQLNTWYEIRARISGDQELTPSQRRELYDAVQGRILEYKAKARLFSRKGRVDGKTVVIFNQN